LLLCSGFDEMRRNDSRMTKNSETVMELLDEAAIANVAGAFLCKSEYSFKGLYIRNEYHLGKGAPS